MERVDGANGWSKWMEQVDGTSGWNKVDGTSGKNERMERADGTSGWNKWKERADGTSGWSGWIGQAKDGTGNCCELLGWLVIMRDGSKSSRKASSFAGWCLVSSLVAPDVVGCYFVSALAGQVHSRGRCVLLRCKRIAAGALCQQAVHNWV